MVRPIVWEYYAATEGGGGFIVGSEEWLKKPGTVGRPGPEFDNLILDDDGKAVPTGTVGTIYTRALRKVVSSTSRMRRRRGSYRGDYFTSRHIFREDGYLFPTGVPPADHLGRVNIYPQEVQRSDEASRRLDVCTIGVPNEEWGEEVKSVVQLRPGFSPSPELTGELMVWARERPRTSCPRSIDYSTDLPRLPSGRSNVAWCANRTGKGAVPADVVSLFVVHPGRDDRRRFRAGSVTRS